MHRTTCLLIALTSLATPLTVAAQGQRMEMISAEGGVHILQEAGAILIGEDDAVIVRMMLGHGARAKDAEPIDLRQGDRILMANKKRVRSLEDFQGIYDALDVGAELKLGVKRGEQMLILTVPKADPEASGGRVMMMATADGPAGGGSPMPGGTHVRSFSMDGGPMGDVRPLFGLGLLLGAGEDGEGVRVAGKLPVMGEGGHPAPAVAEGDVVRMINGKPVSSLEAFFEAYDGIEVGAEVNLELERVIEEGGMRDVELMLVGFPKPQAPKPMVIRETR